MQAPSVLVASPDAELRAQLVSVLESAGYAVGQASSAERAVELTHERRFMLALADLRLPENGALEVLSACRRCDPLSVIVVMADHARAAAVPEALREGAYDYLIRPCAADAILAAARRATEHYRLTAALARKTVDAEELDAKLRRQTALISNVTHELKNPLSVIYGYSAFLLRQRHECKPEDIERALQAMHNNSERLSHLLEEMLESSRLENRKLELSRQEISAAQLASEAVDSFKIVAEKKNVNLRLGPAPEQAVNADPKRVHQIFANLISNALKFTPAGGFVVVAGRLEEGFVRFWVQDTGCGISAHDLPRLFERFYQAKATKAHHAGLGLGLDISKGLVELHGGHIWAESKPGQGATFFFTIPLALHPHRERGDERGQARSHHLS